MAPALMSRPDQHPRSPHPRLAAADEPIAFGDAPGGGEDQRERVVRGGPVQDSRGVGDGDTGGGCCGQVDVVVSNGDIRDHLELRAGGGEQFGVDPFGEGDDRGARTGDAGFEVGSTGRRFCADPGWCAERRAGVPWRGRSATGRRRSAPPPGRPGPSRLPVLEVGVRAVVMVRLLLVRVRGSGAAGVGMARGGAVTAASSRVVSGAVAVTSDHRGDTAASGGPPRPAIAAGVARGGLPAVR